MCTVSSQRPVAFAYSDFEQILQNNGRPDAYGTDYFVNTLTAERDIDQVLMVFCGLDDESAGKALLAVGDLLENADEGDGILDLYDRMTDLVLSPGPNGGSTSGTDGY